MKGEATWTAMIKHWENWIPQDVLPHFSEVVIVISGDKEGGSVLVEVGHEGKKPYSHVGYDWTGDNGSAVIRHAFDVTEGNLEAYRGRAGKDRKKGKKGKKK